MSRKSLGCDGSARGTVIVPYVRYARGAVRKQNRCFYGIMAVAGGLSVVTILFGGLAQDANPLTAERITSVWLPLCALAAVAAWVAALLVYRYACRHQWYCTFSLFDRAMMEAGLPLMRSRKEQEKAAFSNGLFCFLAAVAAILFVVLAVWAWMQ